MKDQRLVMTTKLIALSVIATLGLVAMPASVQAFSTQKVDATIKISICGNGIAEGKEDCDNADLAEKTCASLGFTIGNLKCDIACSFDTSSCSSPIATIVPSQLPLLFTNSTAILPEGASYSDAPYIAIQQPITIKESTSDEVSKVFLPKGTVVTRNDGTHFDATALTIQTIPAQALVGYDPSLAIQGAIQWGIVNVPLIFSEPVTISVYVGSALEGQTLEVMRSTSGTTGWTNDGIVAPATCQVSAGLCNFQVTKASYFATSKKSSTSSSSSSTQASTSTAQSSTATTQSSTQSTTTVNVNPTPAKLSRVSAQAGARFYTPNEPALPVSLRLFDSNGDGKFTLNELYSALTMWVSEWRSVSRVETARLDGSATEINQDKTCDINRDDRCDVKDFSLLLFYVEQ